MPHGAEEQVSPRPRSQATPPRGRTWTARVLPASAPLARPRRGANHGNSQTFLFNLSRGKLHGCTPALGIKSPEGTSLRVCRVHCCSRSESGPLATRHSLPKCAASAGTAAPRTRSEREPCAHAIHRMDADLVESCSSTDGVPSQSSREQASVEHACRALFSEWIDLDGTLHRASCVPDLPKPLCSRAHRSALSRQGGAAPARAHLLPPRRPRQPQLQLLEPRRQQALASRA